VYPSARSYSLFLPTLWVEVEYLVKGNGFNLYQFCCFHLDSFRSRVPMLFFSQQTRIPCEWWKVSELWSDTITELWVNRFFAKPPLRSFYLFISKIHYSPPPVTQHVPMDPAVEAFLTSHGYRVCCIHPLPPFSIFLSVGPEKARFSTFCHLRPFSFLALSRL
jgi:hypothetical protein